jgi:hypothetical protein
MSLQVLLVEDSSRNVNGRIRKLGKGLSYQPEHHRPKWNTMQPKGSGPEEGKQW